MSGRATIWVNTGGRAGGNSRDRTFEPAAVYGFTPAHELKRHLMNALEIVRAIGDVLIV